MKILTNKKEAGILMGLDGITMANYAAGYNIEKLFKYMIVPESDKDEVERIINDISFYLTKIDHIANTLREV